MFSEINFLSLSEHFKLSISLTYSWLTVIFGRVLLLSSTDQSFLFFVTITSGLNKSMLSSEYFKPGFGFNSLIFFMLSFNSSSFIEHSF